MKKIIITSVGVTLLIVLGIYFTYRNNLEDLNAERDQLQSDLAIAKNNLEKEKTKLNGMMGGFRNSFTLAIDMQDQMKRASNIVKQTDYMFFDPNGPNPEFKFTNPLSSILINEQRKNINQLISGWQDKIDIFSVRKINIKESEQIKKDIEIIKKFVQDLLKIVNRLTPANSGLSQDQIDAFILELPSFVNISQILLSVNFSIENANKNLQTSAEEDTKTSTETGEDSSLDPDIFKVTPEDIVAEQARVEEAQTKVADIEEQLRQVEEQIQQLTKPSTPTPAPAPLPTLEPVVNPEPVNPNTDDVDNLNGYTPRQFKPAQGIIIQPGPPRLIQGVDDY